MREIKFRAWDTKYKKMIFTGFHLLGEVMAFNEIEGYLFETKEIDGIPTIERWNDIEAMQYTGLKDKNGKEIYEGDIVKGFVIYNDEPIIRKVVWYEPTLQWAIKHEKGEGLWQDEGFDGLVHFAEAEVIGNIYENPELLKEQQK